MTNAQKIILFLGLFDKETKAQEITTLDAFKIASNLLTDIIGFGTITEAMGVYTHDNGTIVNEPTLRIEVSGIDLESMKKLALALKQTFNQESIGFEVVQSNFSFVWFHNVQNEWILRNVCNSRRESIHSEGS